MMLRRGLAPLRFGLLVVAATLAACVVRGPRGASPTLRVQYLGVSGFLVEHGNEAILTAPLFTRPSWLDVGMGTIASNPAIVNANLPAAAMPNVRAVLTGHAHYDHLLDVPTVLARAPQATFIANRSAKNILAAYAPDRPARCGGPVLERPIGRERVVALDDPARSFVDYTLCPSKRPPNASAAGTWLYVTGSNIRVMGLCSEHPEQLGPLHYAPGGVEQEQCAPPLRGDGWLEGTTLSFLVDFLDPSTRAPAFRVYFQDAPTGAPVGLVPAPLLAEKRIDSALLCVGAYESIPTAPTSTLTALAPRYAVGGHWEDFSRPVQEAPQPIPLLDMNTWVARARYALPPGGAPMLTNGVPARERFVVPRQGDRLEIAKGP